MRLNILLIDECINQYINKWYVLILSFVYETNSQLVKLAHRIQGINAWFIKLSDYRKN